MNLKIEIPYNAHYEAPIVECKKHAKRSYPVYFFRHVVDDNCIKQVAIYNVQQVARSLNIEALKYGDNDKKPARRYSL